MAVVVGMVSSAFSVFAQNETAPGPYIVPFAADGQPDQANRVAMAAVADIYEARDVDLSAGFAFLGISASGTDSTYYSLASWAVSPVPVGWPCPVAVSGPENYIHVSPGRYDISFYSRDYTGGAYHFFMLRKSAEPDYADYPAKIFLMGQSGSKVVLPAVDEGIYRAVVIPPSVFRISYEPRYDIPAFIYGPVSGMDETLVSGVPVNIAYGEGVHAAFTYSGRPMEDGDAAEMVTVSIVPGKEYVVVGADPSTGMTGVAVGGEFDRPQYYDLSGCRVACEGDVHGIFLMRTVSGVRKVCL